MLNVAVEILVADVYISGERYVKGEVAEVAPNVAKKLLDSGRGKKVGVAESEAIAEPEVADEIAGDDES